MSDENGTINQIRDGGQVRDGHGIDISATIARGAARRRRRRALQATGGAGSLAAVASLVVVLGVGSPTPDVVRTVPAAPAASAAPGQQDIRAQFAALYSPAIGRAEAVLTDRCMRTHGFSYPVYDGKAVPLEADYGLTVAQARATGYQSQSESLAVPGGRDADAVPSAPDARARYGRLLFGPDDAPQVTVETVEGGRSSTSSVGCLADARRELFDTVQVALRYSAAAGNALSSALATSSDDAGKKALNRDWSECMDEAGHPGLSSPGAAMGEARRLVGTSYAAQATGAAKEIAIADATCQEELDYAPQRRAIEDRYLTSFWRDHSTELNGAVAAARDASDRAGKILDEAESR